MGHPKVGASIIDRESDYFENRPVNQDKKKFFISYSFWKSYGDISTIN